MDTVWELDFYSRPVFDEHDKKRWEVLICESPLTVDRDPEALFRYNKFCSSTEVNSVWLKAALTEAIAAAQASPGKVRFFRRQMKNMIKKACEEIGLVAQPSRRTFTLHQWLQQRHQDFYPQQPGYKPSTNPSVIMGNAPAQPLPDALQGQSWAMVNLEAEALKEMPEWDISFGEAFPLQVTDLDPKATVPGLIIFSPRAVPLAGWMSGLEMAFLKLEKGGGSQLLILDTGADQCWILSELTDPAIQAEAEAFESAKAKANQVHFLAVQSDPQSQSFAGFWLLQELELG